MPDEGIETLFGSFDENLRSLESALGVTLKTSGHDVVIEGAADDVGARRARVRAAGRPAARGLPVRARRREDRGAVARAGSGRRAAGLFPQGRAAAPAGRRQVTPKSVTQRRYLEAIDQYDIVFGVGPAGTGKTYLAMAQAVRTCSRSA